MIKFSDILTEVKVKSEDRVKLYQDNNVLIVAPLTHMASCKYGANTSWCVSLPSKSSYFNEYIKHGDLIFVIFKLPDSKERKYAYYQSFPIESEYLKKIYPDDEYNYVIDNEDDYSVYNGWYDVTDYRYNVGLHDLTTLNAEILRRYIPDFVFDIIGEYVERDRSAAVREKSLKRYNFGKELINDPNNIPIVLGDPEWHIFYRIKDFGNNYKQYISDLPEIDLGREFNVFYLNKRNYELYCQNIQYYDIRSNEFTSVNTGEPSMFIVNVYEDHKINILKQYYELRKKNYTGIYLTIGLNNIMKGDEIYRDGNFYKVIDKKNGIIRVINISDGKLHILRYNTGARLIIKYEKNRHNFGK